MKKEITQRKRAEEILAEERNLLRTLTDNLPDYIYAKDTESRFLVANIAVARLMGVTSGEELLGKTDFDFYPKELATQYYSDEQELMRSGQPLINREEPGRDPAGNARHLLTTKVPLRDRLGKVVGLVGVGRDITERKRAEEAVRSSEQRLNLALDAAQTGIWELDLVKGTAVRSLRHDQIFGYESLLLDWGYETFITHVVPEDRDGVKKRFEEAFASGRFSMECRITRADDHSLRWIAALGRVYRNDKGDPVRMMGVVTDITERKQAEEEIRKLNRELERRNAELTALAKELEAFSYSVSHDLRSPLRSIDGFSQALLEDYAEKLDAQGQDYLRRVRGNAQRMAQLIDDLLALSRVTRSELRHEAVHLTELAKSVAAELRRAEPERCVEFIIAEGLSANGDARLLRVVLENLLRNAWKYTSKRPRAQIDFGFLPPENGQFVYYVRDDGAGFDMAYAHKLFGAFQRLHTATEFPGTGIGLATVQRVIHRHGGRIWAEGAPEKGATFYFTLNHQPVSKPSE